METVPPHRTEPSRRKSNVATAGLKTAGKAARIYGIIWLIFAIPLALGLLLNSGGFGWASLLLLGTTLLSIGMILLGMRAAGGHGILMSGNSSVEGKTSILVGIGLIIAGTTLPFLMIGVPMF